MKIEYLLRPQALTCAPTDTLEVVATRMREHEVAALAVVEDDRLVAMISTRDMVRAIAEGADLRRTVVGDYNTRVGEVATPAEDTWHVAQRMLDAGLDHIPVLDGTTVVNVVPLRHLIAVEPRPTERTGSVPKAVGDCGRTGSPQRRNGTARRRLRRPSPPTCPRTRSVTDADWGYLGDAAWWLEHGARASTSQQRRDAPAPAADQFTH
jgi:CBS domain-containing protein